MLPWRKRRPDGWLEIGNSTISGETMMPSFSSIPFFVYPVSDMARAKAFYVQVHGLKEGDSWEDKWVEFDSGSPTLASPPS